jgi:hypothetical protein
LRAFRAKLEIQAFFIGCDERVHPLGNTTSPAVRDVERQWFVTGKEFIGIRRLTSQPRVESLYKVTPGGRASLFMGFQRWLVNQPTVWIMDKTIVCYEQAAILQAQA